MAKPDGLSRATGRSRQEWFALLDRWGAVGKPYALIAGYLRDTHGMSRWWAQKVVVEYEQDRGVRAPGVRRDGTFEVTASKTICADATAVFDAIADGRRRRGWLSDGRWARRVANPPRSARFDLEDGSRLSVQVDPKGNDKVVLSLAHSRLADQDTAREAKARWRASLEDLKALLEA